MDRKEFNELLNNTIGELLAKARQAEQLSFLFSILGINSGEEDIGWQPVAETQQLMNDLAGLINGPLYDDARLRLALLLYCHLIEADYHYHCLYNLLLTIDGQTPNVFHFLDKYKNGVPPSVATKISEIRVLGAKHGIAGIGRIFDEIVRPNIRNAFFHSDYILFNDHLRLKHRGSQIAQIPYAEVFELVEKASDFFSRTLRLLADARRSFPKGHVIENRKSQDGKQLCSIEVTVDENGYAVGFSSRTPGPIW